MIITSYKTKTKDLINDFILNHHDTTFSASQVYEYLKAHDATVNVTTVYRNIDRLCEQNILIKRKSDTDDAFHYQVVAQDSNCSSHIHLQCSSCGKLFHLECDLMTTIQSHLWEDHNFTLDCKQSVLKGLCKECKNN